VREEWSPTSELGCGDNGTNMFVDVKVYVILSRLSKSKL
jgi:hypothetical protein